MLSMLGKVFVGGAGLTGAVTASILATRASEVPLSITVWEKANGAGGRMCTSRNPTDLQCTVDLGAQYISATPEYWQKHQSIYQDLTSCGLLEPLSQVIEEQRQYPEGTRHFVAPTGIGSVVKHFLKTSESEVCYHQTVGQISIKNNKWLVHSLEGKIEEFDVVILTFPAPQLLQIEGDLKHLFAKSDIQSRLQSVEYSSRHALGLYFDRHTKLDLPWAAKYFTDDDVVRFVSIDNKKRGIDAAVGQSVAVHTSVPFSLQHMDEDKESVCKDIVLPHLQQLLSELPKHSASKSHLWKYSQVFKGYAGRPGCVSVHKEPLLLLAGDAFTESKFDGCVESAIVTATSILHSKLIPSLS